MKKKIDLVDKQPETGKHVGRNVERGTRPETIVVRVKTSTPPSVARGSLTLTLNEQVDRLEYGHDFSFVVIYVNCACFSQFLRSGI